MQQLNSSPVVRQRKRGRSRQPPISRMVHSLYQSRSIMVLLASLIASFCIGFGVLVQLPRTGNLVQPTTTGNILVSSRRNSKIQKAESVLFYLLGLRGTYPLPSLVRNQTTVAMDHDYGGLEIGFDFSTAMEREPWDFSTGQGPVFRSHKHQGYVQDDDYQNSPYWDWDNGTELVKAHKCRAPAKLKNLLFPTCNTMHEFSFGSKIRSGRAKIVGAGAFREVFAVTSGEKMVFKEATFEKEGEVYSFHRIKQYSMDGVISAAILPHPLYIDLYSFCSLSELSEYMDHGDLEVISLIDKRRCKPKPIHLGPDKPFVSGNNLTVTQKLQYSLDMAEALALMHNHPGGVLTHNDIQLSQFLLSPNGRVKFNDFNRAEVMLFDEEHNQYCKYLNGEGPGDWRSPEEYFDEPLNESIDIFSLANNFYGILTGVYNFPNICSFDTAGAEVKHGKRSYLDPHWKQRSYGEGRLAKLIHNCWHTDPASRPTIGEVVLYLRHTLQKHLKKELD